MGSFEEVYISGRRRERGWRRARADGMKVMSRKNRFIRVGSRALFSARRGTGSSSSSSSSGRKEGKKRRGRKRGVEMEESAGEKFRECVLRYIHVPVP